MTEPSMGKADSKKHALFICEGNVHRSPTAERLYAKTDGIFTRSAGLASSARVQVTEDILDWADIIFVMEQRLHRMLRRRFSEFLQDKDLVCLAIPDEFQFWQAELLAILEQKLIPYLGPPQL